jgi:type IV pilus assembly protein PilB
MRQQLEPTPRRSGALTSQELEISLGQANAQRISLWDLLIEQRRLPEDTVAEGFSTWLSLPRVRLDSIVVEPAAVKVVAGPLARKHLCLPVRLAGKNLVLAMANPLDRKAIEDVEFASSREVQPVVASRAEILLGIEEHYGSAATTGKTTAVEAEAFSARVTGDRDALDLDLDATGSLSDEIMPAVQLCSRLVVDAIELRASDIHIEPGPQEMRVRLRIDGVLREHLRIPHWMCAAMVSRVKVLAKLDIATQRIPQDGRIKARLGERRIDLRVSTLPTQFGEKAVLRLLGSTSPPTLSALGLSAAELARLDDGLSQPQGLILVTGPTGAGKSTTLYSMLTSRQSTDVNVVTIEDPIEYQVPGASQVQVDGKGGVTFASCLRAILRQDPDVILVGEIRDLETAEVAFRAALTGHLVFSTLHTNSSVAAIERLLDLGVKPLLVTAATNLIVAQRLARRICMNCREPYVPSALALRKLHTKAGAHEFQHGRGCPACAQTGYSGRVGIFEILRLTPRLKELVNRRATESEMTDAALEGGTRLLLEDALYKVGQGLTTVEEVLRVIRIEPAQNDGEAGSLRSPVRPRFLR